MLKLFKNKNFTLLYAGNLVSQMGGVFYNFAVSWYILSLTSSPFLAGSYIGLGGLVQLAGAPLAGVLVDRLDKVKILVVTDFIRGFVVLISAYLIYSFSTEGSHLLVLYTATVLLALNGTIFGPAAMALRPLVVEEDDLARANAFFSFIQSIQIMAGILAAGLLYGVLGIERIFLVYGICLIISGFTEMFIKVNDEKETSETDESNGKSSLFNDFKYGVQYVVKRPGLLNFMLAALVLNFAYAPLMANVFPYMFNLVLEKEPYHLSIVQITASAGMLVGGLVVAALGKKLVVSRAIKQGLTCTGLGFILTSILLISMAYEMLNFNQFMILILPMMFLTSLFSVLLNVPFNTGLLKTVDAHVRGRVLSFINVLSQAFVPLSFLLAGLVLEYGSLTVLLMGSITIIVIPYYIMMFSKKTNQLMASMS